MRIEENKPLAPFTTLGIGGPARWFGSAASEEDVAEAAAWAGERRLPLFVLGGGSNVLISDAGFKGLVLLVTLRGIQSCDIGATRLYRVAAGEVWDDCVQRAVEDDCAGIECLAGIPGTVGGTPVQNVGAYSQEVSSSIERVRAFDLHHRKFVEFAASECGFAYRRSRFNTTDRGRYIVTRVDYRLFPHAAPTLRYSDLQNAFPAGTKPTLPDVAAAVRRIRQAKGMLLVGGDPDCRSAGSFFKNPVVTSEQVQHIAAIAGKAPPSFPAGTGGTGQVKVPAAWLIEHAGFSKGYPLGAAAISSRHTLALVNLGGASAAEILHLADQIRSAVQSRFAIRLDMEPEMIGFGTDPV